MDDSFYFFPLLSWLPHPGVIGISDSIRKIREGGRAEEKYFIYTRQLVILYVLRAMHNINFILFPFAFSGG